MHGTRIASRLFRNFLNYRGQPPTAITNEYAYEYMRQLASITWTIILHTCKRSIFSKVLPIDNRELTQESLKSDLFSNSVVVMLYIYVISWHIGLRNPALCQCCQNLTIWCMLPIKLNLFVFILRWANLAILKIVKLCSKHALSGGNHLRITGWQHVRWVESQRCTPLAR